MEVLLMPADASDPAGPEVVHKTATSPGERERLLHEGEVLRTAADRGVTGLATLVVAPSPEEAAPTLITAAVAGPSLAVAAPLEVLAVAGVAVEVAHLLAGLHDAGLVHGAVEPGHVVLDGSGGVILVGVGRGGEIGAPSGTAEPHPNPSERLDPSADVAGWGVLVSHLLDWSATADEEPLLALRRALGGRRPPRRTARPPVPAADHDRRALAALADQAQDPDPARRPTARSLGAAVTHRIPHAHMPGTAAVPAAVGAPPGRPAPRLLDRLAGHLPASSGMLADAGASAVVGGPAMPAGARRHGASGRGAGADRGSARPGRDARATVTETVAPAVRVGSVRPGAEPALGHEVAPGRRSGTLDDLNTTTGAPDRRRWGMPAAATRGLRGPTLGRGRAGRAVAAGTLALVLAAGLVLTRRPGDVAPPPPVATAPSCPPVAPPSADIDGDGCGEAVAWRDGLLRAGAVRFALGGPGDASAVGDWDCDGQATPALLHQGSLIVFDAWPGPGGEEQGRPVAQVPGADRLTVVAGPDGCDRPSLGIPGAADVVVEARAAP